MSEVEFKRFAICDTCGVETLCRVDGEDDQCATCYWAPITHAAHQAELAALREELAIVNREKNDVAYRANETAEKLNSMTISKATMRNQLKQKLASAQQRLADAERRNAELVAVVEENHEWHTLYGEDFGYKDSPLYVTNTAALTKPEEAKS